MRVNWHKVILIIFIVILAIVCNILKHYNTTENNQPILTNHTNDMIGAYEGLCDIISIGFEHNVSKVLKRDFKLPEIAYSIGDLGVWYNNTTKIRVCVLVINIKPINKTINISKIINKLVEFLNESKMCDDIDTCLIPYVNNTIFEGNIFCYKHLPNLTLT